VINNGLNQAWTPFVYANYNKANSHCLLSTNAQKAVLLVLFLGVVLILFSKELLIIIGKIEYLLVLNVLPILVVSYIFQMIYFIQVAIIIYNMQSKLLPVISISSGLVCILSNILLIPKLGMYGAAIGTSISFILMAFFAYLFSRRYLKVQILNFRIFIFLLFMLLILSVYLIFINHFSVVEWFFMKIVLLFSVVILLVRLKLLNFKNLKELFQSI
ncbi:MAG: polysaccharide biosynthesis C-terminal domain-containing protein, partial [bacterium]